MPRIGHLSENEDEFLKRLGELMDLAKEALEIKRDTIERFMENGLYPYSRFYLRMVKERFGSYWKNHFSTIGLLGMNEACENLFGEGIYTERGREFALKVLKFMREKLLKFQEETGNLYNLEATPAESASFRLAKLDSEKFPEIARPFYTNSTHLPVNYTDDPFEVLEHQDQLQSLYTGGTVIHFFLGERLRDWRSVRNFVKKVCENYSIPYFTLTPTFSVCPSHGYISGEHPTCPICGEECEIYSRVVGYFRPVSQWNEGKQEEFRQRKTYRIG
jgi:ribonucleoside-triphosphate reductase